MESSKGTTEALGIQSVGRDLGLSTTLGVHTDSAAAVGICKRAGIGRERDLAAEATICPGRSATGRLPIVQSPP